MQVIRRPRAELVLASAAVCALAGCRTPPSVTPTLAAAENRTNEPRPVLANVGFAGPENLVFDERDNVYLVSNMNGDPRARDGRGFVSRVSADGRLLTLKWIDGSHPATRLDAPKGLDIQGDTLAIADVGCVRLFDVRTGKALGVWHVPGVLMNDVGFAPDGTLYVTDTGPDSTNADGTDREAIYHFTSPGHPVSITSDTDLGGPDGIVAADTMVVYSTFKSNRVIRVAHSGARTTIATLPGGKVDGLRELPHGSYIVTSWDAKTVYHLMPDGALTPIATGITSPAGVAYNIKRDQVGITSLQTGRMYIVSLR